MVYSEAELRAKQVKDLKELCKELGAPMKTKKDDLVQSILATQAAAAGDAAGLEAGGAGVEQAAGDGDAQVAGGAAPTGAEAAGEPGKHAAIVFALEAKPEAVEHKKANIVGMKVLSDAERAQLRAAKFGLAPTGGVAKPGAAAAGGAVPLEEEIRRLERGIKYGKTSEADKAKLEGLQKKLESQKAKQRLALDKAELADPAKLAEREKKFGKPLLGAGTKNLKDPELLKKRADKFGKPVAPPASSADDEARKKARLARFAQAS